MSDFHADFWVAIATVTPVIMIGYFVMIDRYWKRQADYRSGSVAFDEFAQKMMGVLGAYFVLFAGLGPIALFGVALFCLALERSASWMLYLTIAFLLLDLLVLFLLLPVLADGDSGFTMGRLGRLPPEPPSHDG